MNKIDRDFLIELYELTEQEIRLHYSEPDDYGIRSLTMSNDRPIMQIKRKLAQQIPDKRSTRKPCEKIRLAAKRKLDGARWADIAEEFGDGFAKDLQSRYKDDFQIETSYLKIMAQVSGSNVTIEPDSQSQ